MDEQLNILIIEDCLADFLMIERHLKHNGLSVNCIRVDSLEGLKKALGGESWDLVLSDYSVPQLNFQDSLNLMQSTHPEMPVILVSGTVGEEKAVDILKMGAWNFVLKDNLPRLVPVVLGSLNDKRVLEEQRRSVERLKESEERHRIILQTAIDGFWLSDKQGHLMDVNESYCRMSGYCEQELLSMRIADLVATETAGDVDARIKQIMAQGEGRFESRHRRKDGSIFDVEVSALYQPINEGRLVIFLRDITNRKQAEMELQKKNAETEQFIYTVSHDLRSPLVTVKTFMGYLEKDMAEGNQEQLAQDIQFVHSAADKMKLLLDELLEMSRIGRVESPPVKVSFLTVVGEALGALAGVIKERTVDIRMPDTDLMLFGERPRLCQVWQNLIENSIKYSHDNSILRIELGLQQENGETVFFVKDNGIGIDGQYATRIFGIFKKLDPKSPGAGLGLSMVQRIVEKCDGKVWVESDGCGKGSCFKFTLPGALNRE
jgi:PAS domain S-box-containing protein